MLIVKKSMLSGKISSMDLPVTPEQMAAFVGGKMVQDAFPDLSPAQREFILSGITPEEWDESFRDEEDDDEGFQREGAARLWKALKGDTE